MFKVGALTYKNTKMLTFSKATLWKSVREPALAAKPAVLSL